MGVPRCKRRSRFVEPPPRSWTVAAVVRRSPPRWLRSRGVDAWLCRDSRSVSGRRPSMVALCRRPTRHRTSTCMSDPEGVNGETEVGGEARADQHGHGKAIRATKRDRAVPGVRRHRPLVEARSSAKGDDGGEERAGRSRRQVVFVFFSNRLGCVGSLLVTLVLSALLFLLMRGCSSPPNTFEHAGAVEICLSINSSVRTPYASHRRGSQ